MSQENVEVAVKQFEGTNARDFVGVMSTWAEDVTLVVHFPEKFGSFTDTVRGKLPVGEWFGDWFSQFALGYRFDIEELRDAGERVLVVARHHGHGRQSGVVVEQSTAFVYTLREGKVSRIEVWAEENRAQALEAVELREQAMSQENVESVRFAFERFNAGEREPNPELWDTNVEYVPDRLDPEPAAHHGLAAVAKVFRSWVDAYPDLRVEPVEIRAEGNRVFVWVHFSGHGAESGVAIDMDRAQVFTFEHARIVRAEEYFDRAEALEAAGLRE